VCVGARPHSTTEFCFEGRTAHSEGCTAPDGRNQEWHVRGDGRRRRLLVPGCDDDSQSGDGIDSVTSIACCFAWLSGRQALGRQKYDGRATRGWNEHVIGISLGSEFPLNLNSLSFCLCFAHLAPDPSLLLLVRPTPPTASYPHLSSFCAKASAARRLRIPLFVLPRNFPETLPSRTLRRPCTPDTFDNGALDIRFCCGR